ncbi:LCP family protein [Salimicrobium halophilum]|uniref:Cell envelope-related function transcriptional attenuator common domain-containing protein n=1 Tax=Salimicrobium halophilum TaxID=86666 RepID=A0A1G8S0A0_9BACI|nr:LCP family protein [Salimicrobium halophilum]SDJ22633.1 cell envelope-related function transcriptional attenuator common domain-containing protein [Salimicrobium halophilum]
MNKWVKRTLWMAGLLVLLFVGTAAGYGAYLTDKVRDSANESHEALDRGGKSDKRQTEITPGEDHLSVLFVGIDASESRTEDNEDRNNLSDALVLATFNDDDKSVQLLSIPRDTYTYIPEVDRKEKITHAHAYGGIDSTVETVEGLLDVPVDYYVRLNFNSFIEVVNAVGGVKYDVPFDLKEKNSNDKFQAIQLEEGRQLLNGEEALALARTRTDSDIERGQRQMELIKAIAREVSSFSSFRNYDDIIDAVGDDMTTNMDFDQMITFKDYFLQEGGFSFDTMQLEGEGGFFREGEDRVWRYMVNEENLYEIQTDLRAHLDLPETEKDSENSWNEDENDFAQEDEENEESSW